MIEFLEYLVKNLVKHPEDASIREEQLEDGTYTYYLKVNPEDIGKIIGKGGKVIWSIRTLLRVKAQQEGKRTLVKLEEPPTEANSQSTTVETPLESELKTTTSDVETTETETTSNQTD